MRAILNDAEVDLVIDALQKTEQEFGLFPDGQKLLEDLESAQIHDFTVEVIKKLKALNTPDIDPVEKLRLTLFIVKPQLNLLVQHAVEQIENSVNCAMNAAYTKQNKD